jgi:hypothetical protein
MEHPFLTAHITLTRYVCDDTIYVFSQARHILQHNLASVGRTPIPSARPIPWIIIETGKTNTSSAK